MLHGLGSPGISKVRVWMAAAQFEFHLTGSRYFGKSRSDSDWDFFTQDCEGIEAWLKTLGFNVLHTSNYTDCEINKVFRHKEEKIDVQLVKDVALKIEVQEYLYKHCKHLMYRLDRGCHSQIWDMCFKFAKGVESNRELEKFPLPSFIDTMRGFI